MSRNAEAEQNQEHDPVRSNRLKAGPPLRRAAGKTPFPDYPSNARSFIALDTKLLPYWHLLYDLCPSLLKLDPPEGIELFRSFMIWAYRRQPAQDWTFHINLCRWLLRSSYAEQINIKHVDSILCAAAARWASEDCSLAQGILLTCSAVPATTVEWKCHCHHQIPDSQDLPPARFDFAWSPLSRSGPKSFQRWLRVPE